MIRPIRIDSPPVTYIPTRSCEKGSEPSTLVIRLAQAGQRAKGLFLFECAVGMLVALTGAHEGPRRLANLERAREALRNSYEKRFAVTLSAAPSASERLRESLAALPEGDSSPPEQPAPRIHLENQTAFEESIAGLCAWFKSQRTLLQELLTPGPAEKASSLSPPTAVSAPEAQSPRGRQAEILLRDYADELSMAENKLEREFLQAVVEGSECAFKRKEKLKRRLQKRTRWGGREPYKATLKLMESAIKPAQ